MEINQQPALNFYGVDFPSVHFNAEDYPKKDSSIALEITPKVFFPKQYPDNFQIIKDVTIEVSGAFRLSLIAIGRFELKNIEDDKLRHLFIHANAPAIMFPYVRSFIATFTANLGSVVGPITIPPHFFKGDLPIVEGE